MKIRKRNARKEENPNLNNEPVSEEIFFQYQQKRSKLPEGIILKPCK